MAYDAHPVVGELASELYAEPQLGNAIPAAEREKQLDVVQSNGLIRQTIRTASLLTGATIGAHVVQAALISMGVPFIPFGLIGCFAGSAVGYAVTA